MSWFRLFFIIWTYSQEDQGTLRRKLLLDFSTWGNPVLQNIFLIFYPFKAFENSWFVFSLYTLPKTVLETWTHFDLKVVLLAMCLCNWALPDNQNNSPNLSLILWRLIWVFRGKLKTLYLHLSNKQIQFTTKNILSAF